MPLYEYIDETTGRHVEMFMPVGERDCVPTNLKRIQVPGRVGYVTGLTDPTSADRSVPRAFRDLEQTMPAHEISRQSGFTVNQIKQIWGM